MYTKTTCDKIIVRVTKTHNDTATIKGKDGKDIDLWFQTEFNKFDHVVACGDDDIELSILIEVGDIHEHGFVTERADAMYFPGVGALDRSSATFVIQRTDTYEYRRDDLSDD